MKELWGWSVYAWIGLPTVMYGGYALLSLLTKREGLTPFQRTWFRAGHAHAGILLIAFLVFIQFLERIDLSVVVKHFACTMFAVGTLAQSGGFFLHMAKGQEGQPSIGNRITTIGALLLTVAIGFLVYGILTAASAG